MRTCARVYHATYQWLDEHPEIGFWMPVYVFLAGFGTALWILW